MNYCSGKVDEFPRGSGRGSPKKRYRDDKRKIIIKLQKEANMDVEQALFDPSMRFGAELLTSNAVLFGFFYLSRSFNES